MLTLTEELLLLLGDDEGASIPSRQYAVECALAGAVLLDLAFADRIDTDPDTLVVIDSAPTGIAMLDRVLSKIAARANTVDTQTWIRVLATDDATGIREQALAGLVRRGILGRRGQRFPWAFGPVRHTTLDDGPVREARARIEAALADDIPHPRDIGLVALADACQLLPDLFPGRTIGRMQIAQLRRLDLIGREVTGTIVHAARARAQHHRMLLLTFSSVGGVSVAATLLWPRIPVPDRFGSSVPALLWSGGPWQQWSGYLLLALSAAALAVAVIVRKRLVPRIAGSQRWRLSHIILGIACVAVLFAHTGFRLGDNVNAVLMGCYLAALLSGALAGIAIGGARRLRRTSAGRMPVRSLLWTHVLAICPLPALLIVHILLAYLY